MKYLFLANSTKPSKSDYLSHEKYQLNTFYKYGVIPAIELGFEVYVGINRKYATQIDCDFPVHFYDAQIYRNIFNIPELIKACWALYIFLRKNHIDIIHCNTPIGGFVGRLIGSVCGVKRIIYTAHGFHFHPHGGWIKNRIFYSIEYLLGYLTDDIVVMNQSDYKMAQKMKLRKNGKVHYIPGVGIDIPPDDKINFLNCSRMEYRKIIGIALNKVTLLYTGDLIKRKNLVTVIKAMSDVRLTDVQLVVCGEGPEKKKLLQLSKQLNCSDRIFFMGYRNDIPELLTMSDIFIFPSLQEGLPRSVMEAMAHELPVITTNRRGMNDLIVNDAGGKLVSAYTISDYVDAIILLSSDKDLIKKYGTYNRISVQNFRQADIHKQVLSLYRERM